MNATVSVGEVNGKIAGLAPAIEATTGVPKPVPPLRLVAFTLIFVIRKTRDAKGDPGGSTGMSGNVTELPLTRPGKILGRPGLPS